jgi:ubiquinone/menaquinone biosynthesis C-methylase UbiE
MHHPLRDLIDSQGNYFIELKCEILRTLIRQEKKTSSELCVIDIGAGLGFFEKILFTEFKQLLAVDLSREMLHVARGLNPYPAGAAGSYLCGDSLQLPFPDRAADIVFASCMFHHMDHSQIIPALREMQRVCSSNGHVVIFEHNPINPVTQFVVRTTSLDRNARLISAQKLRSCFSSATLQIIESHYILYGPRTIDSLLARSFPFLRNMPLGGQYCIVGRPALRS